MALVVVGGVSLVSTVMRHRMLSQSWNSERCCVSHLRYLIPGTDSGFSMNCMSCARRGSARCADAHSVADVVGSVVEIFQIFTGYSSRSVGRVGVS